MFPITARARTVSGSTASNNYPITAGDSLFTQGSGEASIAVDSSRVTLAPNTELQVTQLDDSDFTATESQGEVFLNLTALRQGQDFNINTPRGEVSMATPGQYEILAGDANNPAVVNVFSGEATAGGEPIYAGQAAYLSGGGQPEVTQAQRDEFADHVMAELAPPPPPYAPPAVQQMTGVDELSGYGTWDNSPQYGAIWYPDVGPGWAPYHYGNWAYVAPWGWTWVDDEPWGFAPFHYGRWAHIYGRWAWVPCGYASGAYVAEPVYAPALVAFFGLGLAAGITVEALSQGDIGWVPLGPDEAYYPHYHADRDYFRRINRMDTRDPGRLDFDHPPAFGNYTNRGAALYGPASAISHGEQVRHYAQPVPHEMFGQARPVGQQLPEGVRPQFTPRPAPAPQGARMPAPGFHPQGGQGFAPQGQQQPYHPQGQQQFHPQQMPQVVTPQEQPQRSQPQFHQQQPQGFAPHEEQQPYHPQGQQQFHPQQMPQVVPPQEQQQRSQPQFHQQQPQGFAPQEEQQPYHPQGQQQFHPQQMPQVVPPQEQPQRSQPQFHQQQPQGFAQPIQQPREEPQPQFHQQAPQSFAPPQQPQFHQEQPQQFHPQGGQPQPHEEHQGQQNGQHGSQYPH